MRKSRMLVVATLTVILAVGLGNALQEEAPILPGWRWLKLIRLGRDSSEPRPGRSPPRR